MHKIEERQKQISKLNENKNKKKKPKCEKDKWLNICKNANMNE